MVLVAIRSTNYWLLIVPIIFFLLIIYFIYFYTTRLKAYNRIQKWEEERKKNPKERERIKKEWLDNYRADLKRGSKVTKDKAIVADKNIVQGESVERDDDLI